MKYPHTAEVSELKYHQKSNGMYILSKRDIEDVSLAFLQEYLPSTLDEPQPTNLNAMAIDKLHLAVEERILSSTGCIIGATVFYDTALECGDSYGVIDQELFKKGTLLLDASLNEPGKLGRRRFTYAHELSHWLLHRDYHEKLPETEGRFISRRHVACRSYSIGSTKKNQSVDEGWEEWQANSLASAFLMPAPTLDICVGIALGMPNVARKYCISGCDGNMCKVRDQVAETFCVSKTAAALRLGDRGYIRSVDVFVD